MDSPNDNNARTSHVDLDMTHKERKRVGFTADITPPSHEQQVSSHQSKLDPDDNTTSPPSNSASPNHTTSPSSSQSHPTFFHEYPTRLRRDSVSENDLARSLSMALGQPYVPRPKPAIRRPGHASPPDIELDNMVEADSSVHNFARTRAGIDAHQRASKLAARVGTYSAQSSRVNSFDSLDNYRTGREASGLTSSDRNKEESDESDDDVLYQRQLRPRPNLGDIEAVGLVKNDQQPDHYYDVEDTPLQSGQVTPAADQAYADTYVSEPKKYRGGILGNLLKFHDSDSLGALEAGLGGIGGSRPTHHRTYSTPMITLSEPNTPGSSPPASGTTTPTYRSSLLGGLFSHGGNKSSTTLSSLVGSSSTLALPQKGLAEEVAQRLRREKRPGTGKRAKSSGTLSSAFQRLMHHPEYRISHIAETIARQKYLIKLCRALMLYGAPTHRLEEYMKYSARLLEINAQFLYLPGCMVVSFDDAATHTADVKLVRAAQGVDLGRLRDVHDVYKAVLHDALPADDATRRLDALMRKKPKHATWVLVATYGLASACVGPFAFSARWIDLPPAFALGALVGLLQLVVAPQSELYANVFEIAAAVSTSFLARALGSIPDGRGGSLFCFAALAQSSIALILPGYAVLCAALELQSRQFVAGAIRMVHAIIYSLFLGFGIALGTAAFGLLDRSATSSTQCAAAMPPAWHALFVPAFTLCLAVVNHAKWKQAPVMLALSCAGYAVSFSVSRFATSNTQVAGTLGAFAIGALANLYSRLGYTLDNAFLALENRARPSLAALRRRLRAWRRITPLAEHDTELEAEMEQAARATKRRPGHALAAAAMLPAIFVQVPSGLAASGSLVAGVASAEEIVRNATGAAVEGSASANGSAFDVGYSVVQVAIGITVGLFLSALLVYPLGKRRSGLFSF